MYVRHQDNCIRIRVSREEAAELLAGISLSQKIKFSPKVCLHYAVKKCLEDNSYEFDDLNWQIAISVNESILRNEITKRPSKKGIVIYRSEDESFPNSVTLEVDLKKTRKV